MTPSLLALDAVGAAFVSGLMLYYGISMISRSLPHLLDAPAPAEVGALIREAVEREVPADGIVSIRTRRGGSTTFAEVAVTVSAFSSIAGLRDGAAATQRRPPTQRRGDRSFDRSGALGGWSAKPFQPVGQQDAVTWIRPVYCRVPPPLARQAWRLHYNQVKPYSSLGYNWPTPD